MGNPRTFDEVVSDLTHVTDRIGEGDPDPTLIADQEWLIREMNEHPDNPNNKPR